MSGTQTGRGTTPAYVVCNRLLISYIVYLTYLTYLTYLSRAPVSNMSREILLIASVCGISPPAWINDDTNHVTKLSISPHTPLSSIA